MGNHICGPLPADCHVEGDEVNCQTFASVHAVAVAHAPRLPETGGGDVAVPLAVFAVALVAVGARLVRLAHR